MKPLNNIGDWCILPWQIILGKRAVGLEAFVCSNCSILYANECAGERWKQVKTVGHRPKFGVGILSYSKNKIENLKKRLGCWTRMRYNSRDDHELGQFYYRWRRYIFRLKFHGDNRVCLVTVSDLLASIFDRFRRLL